MMLAREEDLFLDDLRSTLLQWSDTRVARSPSSVSVSASDTHGFDMAIVVDEGRFTLAFDEWVEEFDDADLARQIFAAALDGTARLRVDMIADRKWRWTLERLDEQAGEWVPESTIGHVAWHFWGRPSVVYLRNTFKPR